MSSKYGFETNEEENTRRDQIIQKGKKEALRIDKSIRHILEDLRIAKKIDGWVYGGPITSQNYILGEWTLKKHVPYDDDPPRVGVTLGYTSAYDHFTFSVYGVYSIVDSKTLYTLKQVLAQETGYK